MFQDGGVFLETFKGASQVSKRSSKGVSRQFQRHFKEVLGVSSVFKEDFKKSFKGFQESFNKFFFQFCCCKDLIAATRAEGGLVFNT